MKKRLLIFLLPIAGFAAGLAFFVYILTSFAGEEFTVRISGLDLRPQSTASSEPEIIKGQLEIFREIPPENENLSSWPRFRGSDYDAVNKDNTALTEDFSKDLKELWRIEVGEGYAGPAIYKGLVYLVDYDHEKQADSIRCFVLATGEEVWRSAIR